MFKRTITPVDLARLKAEREEADDRYNDALSDVDRMKLRQQELPHPPPSFDEHQITPLNELWDPSEDGRLPVFEPGWRGRAQAFVWRIVAPLFDRQRTFNSALVDHVNRNVPLHRATRPAIETTIAVMGAHISEAVTFQRLLLAWLQLLTPYLDSKDREVAGLARRIIEDCRELTDILDHRTVGLAAGIGGVSDELLKRWESMVARERRYESRVSALASEQERSTSEFRTALGVLQKSTQVLRRELERLATVAPAPASVPAAPTAAAPAPAGGRELAAGQLAASPFESYKYVGFEDQFRGSTEAVRQRFESYLPLFEGATDVLDIGCGRGEFLELLRERGIGARGLDINHEMVEVCRERGLEVAEGEALGYVTALPDESLGGLFAAQVIEHLQPDYLLRLLDTAFDKLRPGAAIVLETINPACWAAFFESYIRDITHVRPIHADTLKYLLVASGFRDVEIAYRVPYPADAKLQALTVAADADPAARELVDTYNANVAKLNGFLFTHMDYAAIGRKP